MKYHISVSLGTNEAEILDIILTEGGEPYEETQQKYEENRNTIESFGWRLWMWLPMFILCCDLVISA